MVRLASLETLAGPADDPSAIPSSNNLQQLIDDPNEGKRIQGLLWKAAEYSRDGRNPEALNVLLQARARLGYVPLRIISNILWLCRRLGREAQAAAECLKFGQDAIGMGYYDLGLEACSAALLLDARSEFNIIRDPAALSGVAGLYEQVAATRNRAGSSLRPGGRIHVAVLVPNLVDHVVAYTKTVLHLARYMDREKYRLSVYVSENSSRRDAAMFPFGCIDGTTPQTGACTLKELESLRVPVVILPRSMRFTAAATLLAGTMSRDEVHVLLLASGLACPIDWLAARWAGAPVRFGLHLGTSFFMRGLDATFFDNAENIRREEACWTPDMGERIVWRAGTDTDELQRQPALPRERFGIPPEAVVFGTLSNHLDRRLSVPYMETVCELLKTHAGAWFVAFGSGEAGDRKAFFESRGVASRVVFAGRQTRSGSALKLLDVYLNEFPVGGSQSVVEAMACGIPVVALRWSDAHAESAGASAVGEKYAVDNRDVRAYAALAGRWATDRAGRMAAGKELQSRAEKHYSVKNTVGALMEKAEECLQAKCKTCP